MSACVHEVLLARSGLSGLLKSYDKIGLVNELVPSKCTTPYLPICSSPLPCVGSVREYIYLMFT